MANVRIGVTRGMRGYFAVMYDEDGPIQTGIGSYHDPELARLEALDWAQAEWGEYGKYMVDEVK